MQPIEQILYRPTEAAKALGLSRTRIYELVQSGDLPHVRLGGTAIRIPKLAIERLVEEAMKGTSEKVTPANTSPRLPERGR